jgi:hypothetical protein
MASEFSGQSAGDEASDSAGKCDAADCKAALISGADANDAVPYVIGRVHCTNLGHLQMPSHEKPWHLPGAAKVPD